MTLSSGVERGRAARKRSLASRVVKVKASCGVEAWLIEEHARPVVAMSFNFKGGEYLDPAGKAGATRLMASLLSEGTLSLPGDAFRTELAKSAIQFNVSTFPDALAGSLLMLQRQAALGAELLDLALVSTELSEGAIARGIGMLASQFMAGRQNPANIARDALIMRAYQGHPFGMEQEQAFAELQTVTRAHLLTAQANAMTRANLRIGVAGAITEAQLSTVVDCAFGRLPEGASVNIEPRSLSGAGEMVTRQMPSPQTALVFGGQSIPLNDTDASAAAVALHVFGGGFSSRLMSELREKRGLCYSVVVRSLHASGIDIWTGELLTPNERVSEAITAIKHEVERLLEKGISDAEIAASKAYIIGSSKMQPQASNILARTLLDLQINGRGPEWLDERYEKLAAVTPGDVARVIPRLFSDGRLLFASAGAAAA